MSVHTGAVHRVAAAPFVRACLYCSSSSTEPAASVCGWAAAGRPRRPAQRSARGGRSHGRRGFVCCFALLRDIPGHLEKKKSLFGMPSEDPSPDSVQLKSSIVAYLLHAFFRGMSVFAVCRSFLPVAFVLVSHDLLGQYARRERSRQQYVVTYTCSATVPANAALMLLGIHSFGTMHARNGVPAACA